MQDKSKIENALWGLFISDALSMPAHWYYNREYIKKDFTNIVGYNDAPHPHPESFMVGNDYFPNVKNAKKLLRPYDILHEHARFYNTSYNHLAIKTDLHGGEHANLMPRLNERYHYHHGLKAGENTLGANLIRVLMRGIINNGGEYSQDVFLKDFIAYMTSEGTNKDPYLEIYIRDWFENYTNGMPPELCASSQRQKWSISSHGGIIRPLVLSLLSKNAYEGLGFALTHQQLTHRSEGISSALALLVPMVKDLFTTDEPADTLNHYAKKLPLIKVDGETLTKAYHDANGPANIEKEKMWKLHTGFSDEFLSDILQDATDENIIGKRFATACYPEHGVPLILYFLYKNNFDFTHSLLDNANAGGDNVHRGMILGLLAGVTCNEIPESFKKGLVAYDALKKEIEAFADLCK